MGPGFGYFPNPSKTWLITKEMCLLDAKAAFKGTDINITSAGLPQLGAALGTAAYTDQFVTERVDQWCDEVTLLSAIATTQPHTAFAAFTHGLSSKWSYLFRTIPDLGDHFLPLENIIRSEFIPSLTGNPSPNDSDRDIFALPARLGRLGLRYPMRAAEQEFAASRSISEPLVKLIMEQHTDHSYECVGDQVEAKLTIRQLRRQRDVQAAEDLKPTLSNSRRRALELASERGVSNWLTSLPIKEFGFCLHKGTFTDALALRYSWPPSHTPMFCECGACLTVEHVLSCPRGGFPIVRHNEIRDVTANLLTEVCHDIRSEPDYNHTHERAGATSNTSDGTRLDIAVNGFWGRRFERTHLDAMHPLTETPVSPTATENMRLRKGAPTSSAYVRWNIPPSLH